MLLFILATGRFFILQTRDVYKRQVSGCPLNNLVPEWNDLLYHGNMEQAYNRLHKTNNFPEFTSRVCPALCEKACTCSLYGDAVSVRAVSYTHLDVYKRQLRYWCCS